VKGQGEGSKTAKKVVGGAGLAHSLEELREEERELGSAHSQALAPEQQ
jgi:hypothetical protein